MLDSSPVTSAPPLDIPVANRISVWVIKYDLLRSHWRVALTILSQYEINTAENIRHKQAARDYICRRALLRYLLSGATSTPPHLLKIVYQLQGKPFIDDGPNFNLSHSERWLAIALSSHAAIGIDIEDKGIDPFTIPNRCFSAREISICNNIKSLRELSEVKTRGWTHKEAVVKAHGAGLQMELSDLEVSFEKASVDALVFSRVSEVDEKRMRLIDLETLYPFQASLAVCERQSQAVKLFVLNEEKLRKQVPDLFTTAGTNHSVNKQERMNGTAAFLT